MILDGALLFKNAGNLEILAKSLLFNVYIFAIFSLVQIVERQRVADDKWAMNSYFS